MNFSVFIRSHDRYELLKKSLKSVTYQRKKPIEVFVLDDLNQKKVLMLVKKYQKKFSLIRYNYENTKNKYNSLKNLNLKVKKAKGKYLAFLDDDDTWDLSYLKRNLKIIGNYDVIYSNFFEIYGKHKKLFKINKMSFEENILSNNGFLMSNLIVKKKVFSSLHGFDDKLISSADKDFFLKAKFKNKKIFVQKLPLVNYNSAQLLNRWRWSNDYFSSLPGVMQFYKKYFFKIPFLKHIKMIKKIIIFILLSFRQLLRK